MQCSGWASRLASETFSCRSRTVHMIGATNVEDIYPLTPAQQGMLFHCLHRPSSGVYLDQVVCRLEVAEGFDPAQLHRAFEHVMGRHPVLRSAMVWELADRPHQVV